MVIVVSTVVPVCMLALGFLLVLLLLRWPTRYKGWGRTLAPGVGAQTTLLVTDIQVRRGRVRVMKHRGGEGRCMVMVHRGGEGTEGALMTHRYRGGSG